MEDDGFNVQRIRLKMKGKTGMVAYAKKVQKL